MRTQEQERARKLAEYHEKKQDPEWVAKRRAKALAYYHAHKDDEGFKEKRRQKNLAAAEADREGRRAKAKEYYAQHREERLAYARARPKPDRWKNHIQQKYGITAEQYAALLAEQNGGCAICERPETALRKGKTRLLCVDHEHETGRIRGLLCSDCNRAVGLFKDEVRLLTRASHYLTAHRLTMT